MASPPGTPDGPWRPLRHGVLCFLTLRTLPSGVFAWWAAGRRRLQAAAKPGAGARASAARLRGPREPSPEKAPPPRGRSHS